MRGTTETGTFDSGPEPHRRPVLRHAPTAGVWLPIGFVAVWTSIRLLGWEAGYPLIALIAFTPYVALGSLLPLLVALGTRRWRAAAVAGLLAGMLAVVVVPRALPDAQPRDGTGPRLRVLTANLHLGEVPAAEVIALLRRTEPDVVAFEELSPGAVRALDRAGISQLLPHRILPNGISQDSALYSRFPLRPVTDECDPVVAEPCALVEVADASAVEVRAVHPAAPENSENTRKGQRGLAALPPSRHAGPARILAGDFNATLDHASLRRLIGTGYRDAADSVGAGLRPTWNGPLAPPITIDHVLVDPRIGVRAVSTHRLSNTDHRAVLAELELDTEA